MMKLNQVADRRNSSRIDKDERRMFKRPTFRNKSLGFVIAAVLFMAVAAVASIHG